MKGQKGGNAREEQTKRKEIKCARMDVNASVSVRACVGACVFVVLRV